MTKEKVSTNNSPNTNIGKQTFPIQEKHEIHDAFNSLSANSETEDIEEARKTLFIIAKRFGLNSRAEIENFIAPGPESLDNLKDVKHTTEVLYSAEASAAQAGITDREFMARVMETKNRINNSQ